MKEQDVNMNDGAPGSGEGGAAGKKQSDKTRDVKFETHVKMIIRSYGEDSRTEHIGSKFLPNRQRAIELLELIRCMVFPGFFSKETVKDKDVKVYVERQLKALKDSMRCQIDYCLRHAENLNEEGSGEAYSRCKKKAAEITDAFVEQIPNIRALLSLDIQAAFNGDPAAKHTDETIFCYPGVDAIFTYRVGNTLHRLGVPMLPRIMSEYVHNETGIDIHPGATIGKSFFIDHGTGVVIGETTNIGDRVKLYQGVTLGAVSFARDEKGELIRGIKRHPTIEDDVTIYANAIILGGDTIVGAGSIIGGSVFLTKSVPPRHYVTLKSQDLKYRSAEVHDRLAQLPHPNEPYESDGANEL